MGTEFVQDVPGSDEAEEEEGLGWVRDQGASGSGGGVQETLGPLRAFLEELEDLGDGGVRVCEEVLEAAVGDGHLRTGDGLGFLIHGGSFFFFGFSFGRLGCSGAVGSLWGSWVTWAARAGIMVWTGPWPLGLEIAMRVRDWILVAVLAGLVGGPQGSLRDAARLRREAAEAWKTGDFESAAAKLAQADRIYQVVPGPHLPSRGVVLRARVFSLLRLGRVAEAQGDLQTLVSLRARELSIEREILLAYGAFYDHAAALPSWAEAEGVLRPIRGMGVEGGVPRLAAQVLHDLGSLRNRGGEGREGVALLLQAAAEREKIGDALGQSWSLNNAGWGLLRLKAPAEALRPLSQALLLVHRRGIRASQSQIAANVDRCIVALLASEPSAETRRTLWSLAEGLAHSRMPHAIALSRLCEAALTLDGSAAGAKRFLALRGREESPSSYTLRLALAALHSKESGASPALRLGLDRVIAAKGAELHPHVRATAIAAWIKLCAMLSTAPPSFVSRAQEATGILRRLGDRGGLEEIHELIEASVQSLGLQAQAAELLAAARAFRLQPRRRSLGKSLRMAAKPEGLRRLSLHSPLFRIRLVDGVVLIHDLLSGGEESFELRWQPRNLTINGLQLSLLGDYLSVRGLRYGAKLKTPDAPRRARLSSLPNLHLLERGGLEIFKDGAQR